jgi:GTP-binding protein LepA
VYYRIFNGTLKRMIRLNSAIPGWNMAPMKLAFLNWAWKPKNEVSAGDVGYIITGIKNAKEVKVGDTITTTVQILAKSPLKVLKM